MDLGTIQNLHAPLPTQEEWKYTPISTASDAGKKEAPTVEMVDPQPKKRPRTE